MPSVGGWRAVDAQAFTLRVAGRLSSAAGPLMWLAPTPNPVAMGEGGVGQRSQGVVLPEERYTGIGCTSAGCTVVAIHCRPL